MVGPTRYSILKVSIEGSLVGLFKKREKSYENEHEGKD